MYFNLVVLILLSISSILPASEPFDAMVVLLIVPMYVCMYVYPDYAVF